MREDIKTEIDKIIYYDTEIRSKDIPGYSVGLLYMDSVFIYHYGTVANDSEVKLSDSSIFELGGLSKIFTASLVELLVQDSILDYQKPLNTYLDLAFQNEHFKELTIEDLISHRSRLPKLPYEFGTKEKEAHNPYAHYTKADLLDFYKNYVVDEDTKKEYFYSSINYALLEIAIENSTGMTYEKVLKQRLLDPINLNNTFVHIDPQNDKLPTSGFSTGGNLMPALKFQSFAASEGIKSTMTDLVQFVKTNIGLHTPELTNVLKNTHQPIDETKLNKYAKIAKGWHVVKHKKYYNTILHSGSTNGHRAYIGFVPETKTGVIVLSNSEHGINGLGFLILRMLNHNWKKKKGRK